jgi:hypothetical protein
MCGGPTVTAAVITGQPRPLRAAKGHRPSGFMPYREYRPRLTQHKAGHHMPRLVPSQDFSRIVFFNSHIVRLARE